MLTQKIVEAVRSVIGDSPAALHEPLFIGNEQKYVADAIASGWVAQGEYIERFERMLCDFTGAKYAVATCSGTTALHAAIVCSGYDEKWVMRLPALTFVATANAAVHAGCGIHFVENAAALPVHLLGHSAPVNKGYVRDAAQALGSRIPFDGVVCFSFNGNKIITTGGGGACVTNDWMMANRIRHKISTARTPDDYRIEHDEVAWNYRMPNLNAALGCAQMEQLPYILKAKRALAQKYIEAFSDIDGVTVWEEPAGTKSNYWLVAVLLDNPEEQEPTFNALHDASYQARMLPTPLHLLPMYKDCPRDDLSRSVDIWKRVICLPSSPKLGMRYV